MEHLEKLITEFDRHIWDKNLAFQQWFRNSFLAKVEGLSENVAGLQEELIDLHHDESHPRLLSTASLEEFWTSVKKEKQIIGDEVMTFLFPFATTYLCELSFLALTVIKTKVRNRLDPDDDMRCALSKIGPCIEGIMKEKFQFHE